MINALTSNYTIEAFGDVVAEVLLSPEFVSVLKDVHARERRSIAFRDPQYVYTEEIEAPDGYPCCELVAVDIEDQNDQQLVHRISAQWTVNGDDPQAMGREVKRLIEATRRVFTGGIALIGGTVYTSRADFGPVVAARATNVRGGSGRFVKSGSIELRWRVVAQ